MNKKSIKIKRIIEFLIFILISLVLFEKVTWIFRSNYSVTKEYICGFKNQGDVDVVLYGGSTLFRYYQPLEAWKQMGFTSYNYATSSTKADLLKAYIEESRDSNEAILYVCDVRAYPMVIETVEDSALRNWSDSLPVFSKARWAGISSFLFSRNWSEVDVPSYYLDIIKYHTNTDALKDEEQWAYTNLDTIYSVDKGFTAYLSHVPFERPVVIDTVGKLTEQQEKALEELLDYCDKENLQVLFICCPYIITESDWLTLNAVGERITERGYNFINFNHYYDEIGLNFETDFGDVNHVNFLGAEKYTSYLMNYISLNYNLPDHREDIQYVNWNEDYETFAESQNEWRNSMNRLVDSHLQAKEFGDELSDIDDFIEWYAQIQNDNYTVVIRINDIFGELSYRNPFKKIMEDYDIDLLKEHYIGIWEGDTAIISSVDDLDAEADIGVDGGRGTDKCIISLNDGLLSIADVNYYNAESSIQILVYDNNYKKVIDNVLIELGPEDELTMKR